VRFFIGATGMDADGHTLENSVQAASGTVLIELPVETEYRCPGETHSISRAVHLSRLAAFYPACRRCAHRSDTGQLPPRTVERIHQVEHRVPVRSVFHADGVRGTFLNDLTPQLAGKIAAAWASLLWDQVPLSGRLSGGPVRQPQRRGPSFVVGYDERPSSPSVLAAVTDAVRMMGCPVFDVGLVSRSCFAFTVDHLQVAGGIFITGAGSPASWSGLDLLAESARPLSLGTGLEAVEQRLKDGVTRPTRRAAFQQGFQAVVPYEAGLWKHFHALRPLKVVCAARPRPVRRTLKNLFSQLPCVLIDVEPSTLAGSSADAPLRHEVLLDHIRQRVHRHQAHLGILIGDDGATCRFVDERGQLLESRQVAVLIARLMRSDHPQSPLVADTSELPALSACLTGEAPLDGGPTQGSLSQAMTASRAVFGAGRDQFWFRESFPACDGILTLARVLQALSRGDAPFSAVVPVPARKHR